VPLKYLPVRHKVKVTLPVRHVSASPFITEKLDVRLGYDLCQEEQVFLQKRKRVVASALKRVLHLERDLHGHEVPVIAVMATGGGLRAMSAISDSSHSVANKTLLILDLDIKTSGTGCVKIQKIECDNCKIETEKGTSVLQSIKTLSEVKNLVPFVCKSSLSFYGTRQCSLQYKATDSTELLSQARSVELVDSFIRRGRFCFLIFVTVNIPCVNSFVEWAEFSPYEVAIPKYGASIRSEYFDSEFFMGRRVKKLPESRICYLEGLWTNIFTRNLLDGLYWASNSNEFWERWAKDMVDIEKHSSEDDVPIIEPPSCLSGKLYEMFQDIMTKRPLLGKSHNFLRGLEFHKDYIHQKKFIEWKDTVLDCFPNNLTPLQKYLCLIDVGYFINTSGAALFKPERNVDVIISLDYGLGNVFKQLEMTYKYCKIQKIPFPRVEISKEEEKNPKECYVFSDAEDPRAPIVIHFPLVNDTFKEFKEPGVKRCLSEMEEGKLNLDNNCSPYYLIRLIYSSENFDKLVNLSKYNILNNKDLLLQAIRSAVERRRSGR
ncbi:PA24B phospholipase, partial [Balaeniceps rex]|nr:PA24B phospholipase [Balaeniceps rex]